MRTQTDILKRIEELKASDFFGFESGDLVEALEYEHAKPYLKEGCTKEDWDKARPPYSIEGARNKIRDYLQFAWGKANDERGISSERSQAHFRAWMWLACDDEMMARVEATEYAPYGKPKLKVIEEHYGRATVNA